MEQPHPRSLGKYDIQGVLGKGAMGVVYKGYDPNIARFVAIKTIHASLLDTNMGRELLDRFRNEAQAVGRLNHANIVSIYEFDQDHGTPYFVMEFVEGKDLKSLLKEGKQYQPGEAVHIIGSVLNALEYTHRLGIVHRDIKPANVFITHDGQVKLADFGIAHMDTAELTQLGTVLGTPAYMSPEQCRGDPVDARSDLFSTGVVLYELLVGEKPFSGENSHAILHNLIATEPDRPSIRNSALNRVFDGIVKKALAKDVNQRYQTAEAFRQALAATIKPSIAGRPWVFIGSILLVVLLLAILVGVQVQQRRADHTARQEGEIQMNASAQQAKIQRLLAVAEAHFKVGRLVAPQGSNAFDAYQMVLQLDPQSSDALAGIIRVKDRFFKRAQVLALEGQRDDVEKHLLLAQELFPNDERIAKLQSSLAPR